MLNCMTGMAGKQHREAARSPQGDHREKREGTRACGLRDSLSQVCNLVNSAVSMSPSNIAVVCSVTTQGLAEWDTEFSGLCLQFLVSL